MEERRDGETKGGVEEVTEQRGGGAKGRRNQRRDGGSSRGAEEQRDQRHQSGTKAVHIAHSLVDAGHITFSTFSDPDKFSFRHPLHSSSLHIKQCGAYTLLRPCFSFVFT